MTMLIILMTSIVKIATALTVPRLLTVIVLTLTIMVIVIIVILILNFLVLRKPVYTESVAKNISLVRRIMRKNNR
jgi:hypothetical protein